MRQQVDTECIRRRGRACGGPRVQEFFRRPYQGVAVIQRSRVTLALDRCLTKRPTSKAALCNYQQLTDAIMNVIDSPTKTLASQ